MEHHNEVKWYQLFGNSREASSQKAGNGFGDTIFERQRRTVAVQLCALVDVILYLDDDKDN